MNKERGQTTIDYLVGISIFLLIVGLVFTFVPLSFEPVRTDWGTTAMSADSVVAFLAGSHLAESTSEPGVLNVTETQDFFKSNPDQADLRDALGLDKGTNVNITIENASMVKYHTDTVPPNTSTVVVAKRSVLLDGKQYRLYVRMW